MKKKQPASKLYVIIICLICCITVNAQKKVEPTDTSLPEVPVLGSQLRTLESVHTGRTYDIYIRPPGDYDQNKKHKYPVLYLLDGQWDFKLLDSIIGGLYYDKFVSDIFVVGITYSGDNPDYNALRAMDYTQVSVKSVPGSGDAPKFLNFLKDELFPMIEENYRTDTSRRMLMGSSYGGLFTLYALFTEPDLFSGYVAASPAVSYAKGAMFDQETEYAKKHQELPVKLYLFVGELEGLYKPVKKFMEIMKERDYQRLEMETQIVEGEGHASNKPEGYNRGLRFILKK